MLITILVFAGVLQGQPEPKPALEPIAVATVEAHAPVSDPVLDLGQLEEIRGGDGIILTQQSLSAVNGSTINGNVIGSGNVTIDNSALNNFDGIGNFVMNTGHQNNIQSAVSVSVFLVAPIP